ncbi:DNA translocase FtsK 4TM domain-containing protein [Candidatus Ponderosibacter sp. Uisw_141_02]|uniref:FtsK/SpoIIIE family DNA translocase n=1 Tax=Candidatus Ponderosibacter sp. Uisw_141_02 TaxID=3231000 RepID=UPI003D3CE838
MADSDDKKPIFSIAMMQFLQNRLMEIFGLGLFLISGLLLISLITAGKNDPSFNQVSTAPVANWLGPVGANISAGLYAAIGLASFFLALVPLFWGLSYFRKQPVLWMRFRIIVLPLSLCFLAGGLFALDGGGASDNGGAAGAVIIGMIMRVMQPIPPFMGLETIHYVGGAALFFGLLSWLWVVAISPWQWLKRSDRTSKIGFLFKIIAGLGQKVAGSVNNAQQLVSAKPPRKPKPSRQRQEPVLVADATGHVADQIAAGGKARSPRATKKNAKQEMFDFGNGSGFQLPPARLLNPPAKTQSGPSKSILEDHARQLENVLSDFSVNGTIADVRYGPVVTRYDLNPAPGTKSQRVISLADDIARSMSAISVRVAVVPGQNVIGIELPNEDRQVVMLRDILDHDSWASDRSSLPMALGKDIAGAPVVVDLAKFPHLLVAGTTGSGKSVGINAMILSLLYRHTPETCRMIMIDPKMLELSVYDGIPHLLSPVVTDPSKAVTALKWAVREMENRYRNMAKMGVRNIGGYNDRLAEARAKGEVLTRRVQTGFDPETGKPIHEEEILDLAPLPFIVVLIDEVADLMLVAGKEIEGAVQRLAQMARAAGIHVIMATQRPSVDVITGTIKANFPTRISFQVTSRIDSRTILGEQGAEQLLGRGDMLFMEGGGRVVRVHGPFVDDGEVEAVANFLRQQGEPEYDDRVVEEVEIGGDGAGDGTVPSNGGSLYEQAVALVVREQKASTSFVQRHLKIGYNRAATIIEEMESNGIISAANHVGKRDVLLTDNENGGL